MTTFHVSEDRLLAYHEQRCRPVERASTEAHLLACAPCREVLATVHRSADASRDLDGVWDRLISTIEDEPGGRPARMLRQSGLHQADAVVVRAVAAGTAQWTLAAAVVVATAALAAAVGGLSRSWVPFVVVAPLWPPLLVAATYRTGGASMGLFERTTPYPPARLLLWRTAYVLATSVPVTVGFGALIGGRGWLWASWLLPSVVCTLAVIIAATWTDPMHPAVGVSAAWTAVVVLWSTEAPGQPLTGDVGLQVVCALLAVLGGFVLARRLHHLPSETSALGAMR